jgi:hypothetical protein
VEWKKGSTNVGCSLENGNAMTGGLWWEPSTVIRALNSVDGGGLGDGQTRLSGCCIRPIPSGEWTNNHKPVSGGGGGKAYGVVECVVELGRGSFAQGKPMKEGRAPAHDRPIMVVSPYLVQLPVASFIHSKLRVFHSICADCGHRLW